MNIIEQQKISCPVFKRIGARILDMLLPILITTLFSLVYVIVSHPGVNLRTITLTKTEMIITSLLNLFLFLLFFLVIPASNKGKTIFKHIFRINIQVQSKSLFVSLLLRESLITILPNLIVILFSFVLSEQQFADLFKGEFVRNWASSPETLGFRAVFVVFALFYFISAVTVFTTKKRKSMYDFVGNTWVYINIKKEQTNKQSIKRTKIKRAGQFDLES